MNEEKLKDILKGITAWMQLQEQEDFLMIQRVRNIEDMIKRILKK